MNYKKIKKISKVEALKTECERLLKDKAEVQKRLMDAIDASSQISYSMNAVLYEIIKKYGVIEIPTPDVANWDKIKTTKLEDGNYVIEIQEGDGVEETPVA